MTAYESFEKSVKFNMYLYLLYRRRIIWILNLNQFNAKKRFKLLFQSHRP